MISGGKYSENFLSSGGFYFGIIVFLVYEQLFLSINDLKLCGHIGREEKFNPIKRFLQLKIGKSFW